MNRAYDTEVDATGLACPMPLLKAKRALNEMQSAQRLQVLATDQGSVRDFQVFAEQSGHRLLESEASGGVYRYLLEARSYSAADSESFDGFKQS